ncbi:hypothetical protein KEM55_008116 [Ascosphaera atra]|nr:hypothetical protein KEM55_008116 [Ascosphaera atra]
MSVTSDPENFSLSNNNHNNASNPANNPFGGGTPTAPSRGSLFGGPSSASAHASANASPITLQRPVTAYSSYSGSPALRPTGAAIGARGLAERQGHGFRSLSGTGPHRASNPIPYTSASQQLPYPVNGSTQPTQPGLPGAFAGSANGPSLPHQQRLLSPPLRFAERQYTRERANTSSSLPPGAAATAAAASAGSLSRPSTSSATTIGPSNPAPPNLAMHRMNISTDQAGPANDEDEDRVMRDADVDMDAPEAPESGYQTQAQVQAHQPWMGPQIYCVACGRPSTVSDCLACPECICGACRECVSRIVGLASPTSTGEGSRRCPSCGTFEPRWKPFRLHFRREAA